MLFGAVTPITQFMLRQQQIKSKNCRVKKKYGLSLFHAYLLLNVYGDRNPDLSLAAHARQFPVLLSEAISKFSVSNATG